MDLPDPNFRLSLSNESPRLNTLRNGRYPSKGIPTGPGGKFLFRFDTLRKCLFVSNSKLTTGNRNIVAVVHMFMCVCNHLFRLTDD